jgi:hypothetical protein
MIYRTASLDTFVTTILAINCFRWWTWTSFHWPLADPSLKNHQLLKVLCNAFQLTVISFSFPQRTSSENKLSSPIVNFTPNQKSNLTVGKLIPDANLEEYADVEIWSEEAMSTLEHEIYALNLKVLEAELAKLQADKAMLEAIGNDGNMREQLKRGILCAKSWKSGCWKSRACCNKEFYLANYLFGYFSQLPMDA